MKKEISIYVHIPFCERKCAYCAFNSFCASEKQKGEYLDLLCAEIERRSKALPTGYVVKTIYFGGGTPSVLTEAQFERVTRAIFDNFDVYDNAEFTVEVNPNSVTQSLLDAYKSLRVNRISVGVQSLSNKSLERIGRLHTREMALEKIRLIRKQFANVSCDLIVGLQGENGKALCSYAKQLLALGVKHISCYFLEVYPSAPISRMIAEKKYFPLSDDEQVEAFNKLSNFLQDAGMERYEISNFAFPDYESRHNLNYWQRGEYLGFGLSAHSFFGGVRSENAATMTDYAQGKIVQEKLSAREEDEEKIMLGLRCNLGVNLADLKENKLEENPYFQDYLQQGVLTKEGSLVKLNPMFYQMSNTIISNLFN